MPHLTTALVAAVAVASLSACGGADDSENTGDTASEASATDAESTAEGPTDESSVDDEMKVNDVEHEAKNVGFDVADYAIKNDFTNPKDQADFEKNVDYAKSLRPGSEAGYEVVGDNFRTCVTHYADGQPEAWAIYDGKSGLSEGAVGAPDEEFCP